jgi:hypothetical protein
MQIRLERLWSPECAEDAPCALCGQTFTLGVVIARAVTRFRQDGGEVCPECALYLAGGSYGTRTARSLPQPRAVREPPGRMGRARIRLG